MALPRNVVAHAARVFGNRRSSAAAHENGADRYRSAGIGQRRTRARGAPSRWLSAALCMLTLAAATATMIPSASAQSATGGTVVIANGWSSADSAVASALAAVEGSGSADAVVLYATSAELTSRTAGYISEHKPAKAILVGGTSALSAGVADEVAALLGGAAPERISGSDRFDTAAKAVPSGATTFVIANGYSAADTGVAAALAAVTRNAAVLLATKDSLTAPTEQVITSQQPSAVVFVGGTAVLGESLVDRVRELAPDVSSVPRHSGRTRSHTAAAAAPSTATTLVIANGYSPADTGVAAALAATTGNAAVLYATATSLTAPTSIRISELNPRAVILVGGTTALGSVLHRSIHCRAPGATISRIRGTDRIDTAVRAASGDMTSVATNFDCGAGGGGGGGTTGSGSTAPPTSANVSVPAAPTSVYVVPKDKALELSWNEPSSSAPITVYSVEYQKCSVAGDDNCTGGTWGDDDGNEDLLEIASTTTKGTSLTVNGPAHTSGVNNGKPCSGPSDTPPCELTNRTAYRLRVRAHSSGGAGAWSAWTSGVAPEGKPSAPTSLTVTIAHQSLMVGWNAPASDGGHAITGYGVQYRACTQSNDLTCATNPTWDSTWSSHAHTGTGTSATIGSLTNGTAYQVQVHASNSLGNGQSATASGIPKAVPAAPAAPAVTAGDEELGVSWTPPAANGSAITDYDVRYSSDSGANWTEWNAGNTSSTASATVDNLTNGTAYVVQVRAGNANGDGPWSPSSSSTTPYGKPNAPTGLTVETVSATSLKASWTEPDTNGKAITDYDVQYRACTNTNDLSCATNPAWASTWTARTGETTSDTATTATITGLTASTAYQVQVRAANGTAAPGGESAWSASATGTPNEVPGQPAAPTVNSTVQDRKLEISWAAPANTGGAINDYDVQYRACTATPKTCASNPTWGSWSSHAHTGTATTATISSGIANGTKYEVQVRASNRSGSTGGTGQWSPSGSAIPAAAPTVAPGNLTTTRGDQRLTVAWTAPSSDNGSPITAYIVRYCGVTTSTPSCSDRDNWDETAEIGATNTATVITGLTNGVSYQWQVMAKNVIGGGPWSAPPRTGTPATTPGLPKTLQLVGNDSSLTASWEAPDSDGGLAINDYDVRYRVTDTNDTQTGDQPGAWTDRGHSGTATTSTITGLTNGTEYDVQVRAGNSIGKGEWTGSESLNAGGAPLAPARPTVTTGDQQLTVSWAKPDDNGGGDITSYMVEYREQDTDADTPGNQPGQWSGDSPTPPTPPATPGTTHVVQGPTTGANQGLVNGTVYEIQVAGVNARGRGAWSPAGTGTPAGTPSAPNGVNAAGGNTTMKVTWDAPDANGSNVTGFKVQHCTGDSDCAETGNVLATASVSGASARSYTITGLTNALTYDVRVQTVSSDQGDSAWSDVAQDTAGGPPSAPTGLTVVAGDTVLDTSWTAPSDDGGWTIASYHVQYCDNSTDCDPDDDDDWTDADSGLTARAKQITGLTNGTTYQVRVRAYNSQSIKGPGPWSSTASGKPATNPSAPTGITLESGNASLKVGWGAPVSNGSTVTGFQVRHCEEARTNQQTGELIECYDNDSDPIEANWTTVSVSGASARSTTLSGLTNGARYSVQVRVVSSDEGNSTWTTWTQTGNPGGTNEPGVPAAPSISATAGDAQFTVSWTAPANRGDAILSYELMHCNDTDDDCDQPQFWSTDSPSSETATSHTVSTGIVNGKTYQVRLRAQNSRGNGPWSNVFSVTPTSS